MATENQWDDDCKHFHGKVLTGNKRHYCPEFDYLPIDETCSEFEFCSCLFDEDVK